MCDFVEPLGKSQPTISHHLKILSEAGLVQGRASGRGCGTRSTGTVSLRSGQRSTPDRLGMCQSQDPWRNQSAGERNWQ